ncbi:MAG: DUF839 domain-containing protein, partial [Chitinophagaceae bacterium]|nr:DUF839 domain-containing protein [Rubrivivax sp.]
GRWQIVRPSIYARRITATTPLAIGGPAAGQAMMKTAVDPTGRSVLGTLGNCGSGRTPWGTCLSGEKNWADHFSAADTPTAHERRFGIRKATGHRWPEHDERFDTVRHPNEPHRFGWVVEVDPMDSSSVPVKRTALGRAAHTGTCVAVTKTGLAVVYTGDDARLGYIYRFVSRDPVRQAGNGLSAARANAQLLDHGLLSVARFDVGGRGRWLPLTHGQGPLTAANGFADPGEVLIKARQASDLLGATKLDRPQGLAIDEMTRWVHCALSNSGSRGQAGLVPGLGATNQGADHAMGQIIRWHEDGNLDGEGFAWNHLALASDAGRSPTARQGDVNGDPFSSPGRIAFDARGVLWVGTGIGIGTPNPRDAMRPGNNALLACDPATGEFRRFLTGPVGCAVTGAAWAGDGRTMFVNIQHPGAAVGELSDPAAPDRFSRWPDHRPDGRPRSATVAIRRQDGGVIGA